VVAVSFEGVGKTYPNGHRAVEDFHLDIADGELMVFVGPSGCGKSTLLRMLAGLEELSSGEIRIGSRPVNGLTPQERNIAMVFQDYALYPNMTVRGNLEFPLAMRRLAKTEIRRRATEIAAMLDMGDLLERYPRQLSGGQRQRVAMGRALVREPSVFLMDEPLSNLDAKLRVQMRGEIGELQKRLGTTMIYVTHDQMEAMTLGHRIAVLRQGRLQQVASPGDIYGSPANPFVAGFMGNPPMNLFPTRLIGDPDGQTWIAVGEQRLSLGEQGQVRKSLAEWDGRPLVAGIRPESLRLVTDGGEGLAGEAEMVEYLGHETLVHFRCGGPGPVLIARLPGLHALRKGQHLRFQAAADAVLLFPEPESGGPDFQGQVLADSRGIP
jgi:multiple sugar transport system ATP-binding protein